MNCVEVLGELIEVFVVDVRKVRPAKFALFMIALKVDSEGIKIEIVLIAEIAQRVVYEQVLTLV